MDALTAQSTIAVTGRPLCCSQTHSCAATWTGQDYLTSGYSGLRLLLVGERPLGVPPVWEEGPGSEAQSRAMSRTSRRFWRNVVNMIQVERGPIGSEPFWRKIAYGTYLQTSPPPGRRALSPEMWVEGQRAFVSLVGQLAPHCVLALGYRLYDHVVPLGTVGPAAETFSYGRATGVALVARIMNPLAPGFVWQREALKIKRAVTLTKLMRMA